MTILEMIIMLFTGAYLGMILERYTKKNVEQERLKLRKSQYTGQTCEQCGNGQIFPASCDTCGARWLADMHLEGEPRKPIPEPRPGL